MIVYKCLIKYKGNIKYPLYGAYPVGEIMANISSDEYHYLKQNDLAEIKVLEIISNE